MAEAFGVVAGTMGISGLFNNCVDCFGYIHLARTFDRDFRTAQLRLDFARLRLTRWGEAVGANQSSGPDLASPQARGLAAQALWQIFVLFAESARVTGKFKNEQQQPPSTAAAFASVPAALSVYDPDADRSVADFHNRLLELARPRESRVGVVAKVKWALHRGKYLDSLIGQITSLIDQLFTVIPDSGSAARPSRLAGIVAEEVAALPLSDLERIEEDTASTDELLRDKAREEVKRQEGGHTVVHIEQKDEARAHVGDMVSSAAIGQGYRLGRGAGIHVEQLEQANKSRFHGGHIIGGTPRSVFDD